MGRHRWRRRSTISTIGRSIPRAGKPNVTPSLSASRPSWRESATAYLYLAPAGVILFAFWVVPVAISLGVSFTNWEGADTLDIVGWTGWRNYARTLADDEFWLALANTINYVLYFVPLVLAVSLGAALLIHRKLRASGLFRTIFFLPFVSTWVSISIVWRYFFSDEFAPLNDLLQSLGLPALRWLQEPRGIIEIFMTGPIGLTRWPDPPVLGPLLAGPSLSMMSIIVTSIWRDFGFFMVIFLAGLNNIDSSYYEAAKIDGAGPWQRLREITLPLLTPTTFFLLLIAVIGAFRVFVPILVMTPDGGPAKATSTLVFYMYQKGFMQWKLGLASSIAYLLFVMIFTLTMIQNRFLGRWVQYGS